MTFRCMQRVLQCFVLLCAPMFAWSAAHAQDADLPEGQVRWPIDLAKRVAVFDHVFPVVDRVVIVPDVETYIDELERWSPQGRWPVLFDDLESVARFVRAFEPAAVYRRESVRGDTPFEAMSLDERQARLERIVARSFAGNVHATPREAFASKNYTPPGIVLASLEDPAWTAAIALAAGRGQWLSWLNDRARRPNATLPEDEFAALRTAVESRIVECGTSWNQLGDALETITLCRAVATKVDAPEDRSVRAITDLLGRHADGSRYAFTGMIFGDEARCAAMAMAALFLDFESATMLNTYPAGGGWDDYEMRSAETQFQELGMSVTRHGTDATNALNWRSRLGGGWTTDLVWVNSRGRPDDFRLADNTPATAGDVPMLNTPAAVHMIHSWSMSAPETEGTIGRTWLDHGACAVVGSVHEPMLQAFVQPRVLAMRCGLGVPYLVAARHWAGPRATPWKINTIGDPLMQVRPLDRPERLEPEALPMERGENVQSQASALLQQAKETKDPEVCRAAVAALVMIGRDEIAADFWTWSMEQGCGARAAHPALGAIFRRADADAFIAAYDACGVREEPYRSMLWQLVEPRLHSGTPEDELLLLQSSVRGPRVERDLMSLLPHLRRAFGSSYADGVLQRAIDEAPRKNIADRLRRLQRRGQVSAVWNTRIDNEIAVLRVNRRPAAVPRRWQTEVPPPVVCREPTRCTR